MALNAIRRLTPGVIERLDAKSLDRYIRSNSGEAIDTEVADAIARARAEMPAWNWPNDSKEKLFGLFDELPKFNTHWK